MNMSLKLYRLHAHCAPCAVTQLIDRAAGPAVMIYVDFKDFKDWLCGNTPLSQKAPMDEANGECSPSHTTFHHQNTNTNTSSNTNSSSNTKGNSGANTIINGKQI